MFKPLEYIYFLVALVVVTTEMLPNEELHFFSKCLLMLVLGAFYIQSVAGKWNKVHKLLITAIFFSWVGDMALMFVSNTGANQKVMGVTKAPGYFLLGLGAFLVAHLLYILAFTFVEDKKARALLSQKIWIVTPLLVYFSGLLSILIPTIYKSEINRPILIPVLFYSTAIGIMVILSINRYKRVNDTSFIMVFAGAVLFMLSDSILAINKFVFPFAASGILLMPLYIGGQYLIAKGCLAQFHQEV